MRGARGALAFTIGTLDPYQAATAGALAVLSHVHDSLMRRDSTTGELSPGILACGSQRVGETTYLLEIAEDARFHDDTRVTAEDLVASIRMLLESHFDKTQLLAGALGFLRDAKTVATRQVQITTHAPMPLLDERLTLIRVLPDWLLGGQQKLEEVLMGTGPYRVVKSDPFDGVVLEAAGSYLRHERDALDVIELVPCLDAAARIDGLIADEFLAVEDPTISGLRRIEDFPELTSQYVPSINMTWLMFNCADPALSQLQVRQALSHAIDRKELARTVHQGAFIPSTGFLPSEHADFVPTNQEPTFDLNLSRELLEVAGFGGGLELSLLVSSASWVMQQAKFVVEQLSRVGVSTKVRVAHTADLFSDEIPAGEYQLLLASGDPTPYGLDGEFVLRWYLSGTWARKYCHWSDPVVDEIEGLLDLASRVTDVLHRRDALGRVQMLAAEHVPLTVLGHRPQPTAWSTRLRGFRPSCTTGLNLRNTHIVGSVA